MPLLEIAVNSQQEMGMGLRRNRYESDYRVFIQRLRSARENAQLTQAQVARRLHVPQSFVSKCESGERRVDIVELRDFARIYGKPLTDFLP